MTSWIGSQSDPKDEEAKRQTLRALAFCMHCNVYFPSEKDYLDHLQPKPSNELQERQFHPFVAVCPTRFDAATHWKKDWKQKPSNVNLSDVQLGKPIPFGRTVSRARFTCIYCPSASFADPNTMFTKHLYDTDNVSDELIRQRLRMLLGPGHVRYICRTLLARVQTISTDEAARARRQETEALQRDFQERLRRLAQAETERLSRTDPRDRFTSNLPNTTNSYNRNGPTSHSTHSSQTDSPLYDIFGEPYNSPNIQTNNTFNPTPDQTPRYQSPYPNNNTTNASTFYSSTTGPNTFPNQTPQYRPYDPHNSTTDDSAFYPSSPRSNTTSGQDPQYHPFYPHGSTTNGPAFNPSSSTPYANETSSQTPRYRPYDPYNSNTDDSGFHPSSPRSSTTSRQTPRYRPYDPYNSTADDTAFYSSTGTANANATSGQTPRYQSHGPYNNTTNASAFYPSPSPSESSPRTPGNTFNTTSSMNDPNLSNSNFQSGNRYEMGGGIGASTTTPSEEPLNLSAGFTEIWITLQNLADTHSHLNKRKEKIQEMLNKKNAKLEVIKREMERIS